MIKIILSTVLLISASFTYSASSTDLSSKWMCSTNASSSDKPEDQKADDYMANTQGSATDSFAFAEKNCRDCTKVTCEAKD